MPKEKPKTKIKDIAQSEEDLPRRNANEDEAYDKFELSNACSTTDCTGLIQTPPLTEGELESYMDVYDFQPPNVTEKDDKSKE